MEFIAIKTALQQLLVDKAAGRYQVIGFQRQEKSAVEFTGANRLVEVYSKRNAFPTDSSSYNGPVKNNPQYMIELTVSAAAEGDIAVLNDDLSTPAEKQAALLGLKESANRADQEMDALISIVWNVLMNAENTDLGLDKGRVASRWVSETEKSDPNERGELVVLTASIPYACSISELPGGDDTGVDIDSVSVENNINDDQNQKTGTVI